MGDSIFLGDFFYHHNCYIVVLSYLFMGTLNELVQKSSSGASFPDSAQGDLHVLYARQRHPPTSDAAKIRLFRSLGYGEIVSFSEGRAFLRKAYEFAYLTDLGVL